MVICIKLRRDQRASCWFSTLWKQHHLWCCCSKF